MIASVFLWLFNPLLEYLRKKIYSEKIIFNCCWEDPLCDIKALQINENDNLLCITSAGCNILTYLLENVKHIYAIDVNPCQNALLQLKIASIKELDYPTYWQMWGNGQISKYSEEIYPRLRNYLTKDAQFFWDNHQDYFDGKGLRKSFYWRGCTGFFAYLMYCYFRLIGVFHGLHQMFHVETIDEQERIYEQSVRKQMWNSILIKFISSSWILSLIGVPTSQQNLIDGQTFAEFIPKVICTILTKLPLKTNYFYHVYFYGRYSKECCPEYLKEENFSRLKSNLIERISIHTTTITQFLKDYPRKDISKFILLDHMDWLATKPEILSDEWQEIFNHSTENCRYIWRSISSNARFIDKIPVIFNKKNNDN